MNEAPELAYIVWFHDGDGYAGDATEYSADFGPAYIRADIHEARVKELELPADDTRSYDKGYTQGYSEGVDDGENMVRVALDEAETRVKELEDQLAEVLKKIGDLDKFIERLTST